MKGSSNGGRWRVAALAALCVLVFALFAARLAWLQFAMAEEYARKAAEASTAAYTLTLPAARGAIVDRNGVPLAADTTVYDLYLAYPAPPGSTEAQTLRQLARLGLLDVQSGKDVETQLAAFSHAVAAGALPLARGLEAGDAAALYDAGLPQSGAVWLTARGRRGWPAGTLAPHTLGFTGPVTPQQWQAGGYALRQAGVAMDAELGQSGLEAAFDDLLRGVPGQLQVRVAAGSGEVLSAQVTRAPAAGATLTLCLDAELQQTVQTALEEHIALLQRTKSAGNGREANAGAAVVVDVRDGGILAAASWPGYDLSSYRAAYAQLAARPDAPLLDRVQRGLYAPGSAFKPAVAAAALAAGLIRPQDTVRCTGRYRYYRAYQPRCLQLGHGGAVDLYTALEHSCNIFFYDVGRRLGVDAFSATAQLLGLGADPGAELEGAAGSLTWSGDANYQPGLELQAAIGQGNTAVTPLQLAAYAAALANNGVRRALHYARSAQDPATGRTVWRWAPAVLATAPGGGEVFAPIREGMERMAATLSVLRGAPVRCAAKTGSPQRAQTLAGQPYTNSVLIAYAPADDPQIAVSVVLEYGGGGANAAPILRAILDAWPLWKR